MEVSWVGSSFVFINDEKVFYGFTNNRLKLRVFIRKLEGIKRWK